MIRTLVFAALVALSRVASAQSIEAQLDKYMSAREALGQFSGAVLVAKNGRILLEKGYGYADIEKRIPNSAQTKFRAASISKQFTAMAIMRLREMGKLKLTDSICSFIDRCPTAWSPVTIAHLIHHSSGIPDYEEELELGSPNYMQYTAQPNVDRILDSARVKPLDFPPGSKFHYSNTGYILLSKVIERESGMQFGDYMQRMLLDRAGLTHSGVLPVGGNVVGLAQGYQNSHERPLDSIVAGAPLTEQGLVRVTESDMSGAHGDAFLYTTVGDLYKWNKALDDPGFLAPHLRREFETPSLGADSVMQTGYAWGLIMNRELGTRVRFHTGALPGFVSRDAAYPDSGVVVIVMANGEFFRVSRISRDLAAQALGLPYDLPRSHKIIPRDTVAESKLAGRYMMADSTIATVTVGERYLELQVPKRFTAGLLPESSTLFFAPFFEGTVRFDRDAAGNVTQLVMHYDGIDRPARRQE